MDEHVGPRDGADPELRNESDDAARAAIRPDPDLQELERLERRLRDLEQRLVGADRDADGDEAPR
jgi:hypothetical protein